MRGRITFVSDAGRTTFKVKSDELWKNLYSHIAFLAESGLGEIKFMPKESKNAIKK